MTVNETSEAMRSHGGQLFYSQWDTLKTAKTKPRRSSSIVSIVYGQPDLVLWQVATDVGTLYIADLVCWDGEDEEMTKTGDRELDVWKSEEGRLQDSRIRVSWFGIDNKPMKTNMLNEIQSLSNVFSAT